MGLALVRLRRCPDRPAAVDARAGASPTRWRTFTGVDHDTGSTGVLFNPFAAIPSMHVAFALMLGVTMAQIVRRRWAQGAVVALLADRHLRGRSPRPTTGGSTPSSAPPSRPSRPSPPAACSPARGPRCGRGTPRRTAHQPAARELSRTAYPSAMSSPGVERPPRHGARVPGADAQPPDRVAADAERDLAHRPRAVRRRGRARVAGVVLRSAASPSSSARSATRSTAATRACRARARRSARSWTRRSTAWRRASCSPRSPCISPAQGDDLAVAAVVVAVLASLMVSYTRARAEALGVECKVGIADRAVRVVILSAGLVFADLDVLDAGRLRAGCAVGHHGLPAHLARALAS